MFKLQNIERDFAILEDLRDERESKIYKERFMPFDLDDEEFFSRYRLDKIATRFLINLLNIEEPANNRGLPIPKSLQVLTTLRYLGGNSYQSQVADLHGISQPSVGRVIKNISKKIALLLPHFVKFPSNAELNEVKKRFQQVAEFPAVVGVINCTHVHVKCPTKKVGPNSFSLTVQIVCDADGKITDVVATSQGSKHDPGIWAECEIKKRLELSKSEHNGVLLGDAGYPLSSILLTTIRNPSSPKEERYNKSHVATRSKIECLSRQLKSKFRVIFERLRVDLDTAKNIVLAVAVLHNIAMERNSTFLDVCLAVEGEVQNFNSISDISSQSTNRTNSGNAYRAAFINAYF